MSIRERELTPAALGHARAEIQFAEFYRTRVRRAVGCRVQSADLLAAYLSWAGRGYGQSIGHKQLCRFMRQRGHRHFYSNRAWFGDVEILAEDAAITGAADQHQYELSYALDMVARIDAITSELARMRAVMVAAVGGAPA